MWHFFSVRHHSGDSDWIYSADGDHRYIRSVYQMVETAALQALIAYKLNTGAFLQVFCRTHRYYAYISSIMLISFACPSCSSRVLIS